MAFEGIGKVLIIMGGLVLVLGIIVTVASRFPAIPFLGKLPGDILISKDGFSFYVPLTTSIVLSILLTILLSISGRFFK